MTSKLNREQRINEVKELIADAEQWAGYYEHPIHDKPQREMFEGMARVMSEHLAALAAMDSEPVMYCMEGNGLDPEAVSTRREVVEAWVNEWNTEDRSPGEPIYSTVPLYRHAQQPTPERDQVRREHAEWSQATFGDVGPIGPLKHLSKEALEAAAEPDDLSEWADMQFLMWDAQRRTGITDEQITQALIEKLAVNKQRKWPEPKDGEPRLHIKEQPAPDYPEVLPCPVLLEPGMRFGKGVKTRLVLDAIQRRAEHYAELEAMTPEERAEYDAGIEAFKAMLPQPAPVVQCPFPCGWDNLNKLAIQNSALVARYLSEGEQVTESIRQAAISNNDSLLKVISACRAAMLQAVNSPVIPDGYNLCLVPMEHTEAFHAACTVAFNEFERGTGPCGVFIAGHRAMLAAAPREVNSES